MERRSVQWGVLLAVVLLATVLRVYQLKAVPAGLFCDEAALGYNAWAIGTTGMDENGKYFPLFIWSFGGYKNPVYVYSAIIPVKLLGLDEFSLRLTSALFGVGTIIGIFFLGRALFTPWVGVFAAVFLAVCPWHLHFSRIAFELISFPFLFIIGLTLLVRYTEGRRTLPAAMLLLGLCLYAYAIAAVFVPLFLIGFALLYLPTLLRRWRETLLGLAALVATVAPAAIFLYVHRQLSTMYFRHTTNLDTSEGLRALAQRFGRSYLQFFSRDFLLDHGDPIVRHAVRGFGELLPVFIPFLILGAVVALLYRNRAPKLILWWLAVYPVAPSLMNEIPSASRGIIGVAAFCLLAAVGLAAALRVLGWIGHWRPLALALQAAALVAVGHVLVPEVLRYWKVYVNDYPRHSAPTYRGFQYGYRHMIQYMESRRADYDLLMLTETEGNQSQIFPLFYNHVDPRVWNAHHDLGYLVLDPAEYSRYSMNQRILYALRPSDLEVFSDYKVLKRIVAPGGEVEFVIAEVRARKHFLTNWLVLGTFLNDNGKGVDRDVIDWRQILPQFVRVDLDSFFAFADPRNPGNAEHVCAYAALMVRSPSAQRAFLEVAGSRDIMRAWLNGGALTPAPILLNEMPTRRPIDLEAGGNLLVVSSCKTFDSWYFTARITDDSGRDVPDITTAPGMPEEPIVAVAPAPAADTSLQVVEGFGSILTFKHTDEKYPDYRGGARSWWAHVDDAEGEVTWRTAPCPQKKRTIFALTASMSEAPGEAELFVNDTYALTFKLSDEPGTHTWESGSYRATFVSKGAAAGNSGILLLEVPPEQITVGQSVEIRVVLAKAKEDSWFMIKAYQDTLAHEHVTPAAAAEMVHATWQSRAN